MIDWFRMLKAKICHKLSWGSLICFTDYCDVGELVFSGGPGLIWHGSVVWEKEKLQPFPHAGFPSKNGCVHVCVYGETTYLPPCATHRMNKSPWFFSAQGNSVEEKVEAPFPPML